MSGAINATINNEEDMFGHRVSKFGYVLAVIMFACTTVNTFFRLPFPMVQFMGFFTITAFVLSFCAVFLGVIARGFERVEAAILSRREAGDL